MIIGRFDLMYKTIGLDIDNTLTKIDTALRKISEEFNVSEITVDDVYDYDLCVCFGVSKNSTQRFWNEREVDIIRESELAEDRYESIMNMFGNKDTTYHILTSRHPMYREETVNWLKRNNIEYDKLIMTAGASKIKHMKDLDIDLMVDDLPKLFYDAHNDKSLKTDMACIKYPYNINVPRKYLIDLQGNLLTD